MKKYTASLNRFSFLLLFFFAGASIFLTSCQDDEQDFNAGVPVLERVRLTDPNTADSTLEQAGLGSTLVIVGQNLASTEAVFLNNYRLGVNPAYATETHLIVQVADSVPTLATDPNVPNELRVVNPWGEATMQFQTLPPAPVVEQISNLSAKPGETITLYGRYFFFVDTVHFPGGAYVTDGFTTNASGSRLTVTVPEEGFDPTAGHLRVVSQSGRSRINSEITVFDSGAGLVGDFDTDGVFQWPQNGSANWGWGIDATEGIVNSAPEIEPLDGYFGVINLDLPGGGGWANAKVINLANWGGTQIYPEAPVELFNPETPIGNYAARMEVAVAQPDDLTGIELQVMVFDANGTELTHNVPLSDFVHTTDGTWYTVTVPLDQLANANGAKLSTYGDLLNGESADNPGVRQMRASINNTNADAVPAVIGIDNMRVTNIAHDPSAAQ